MSNKNKIELPKTNISLKLSKDLQFEMEKGKWMPKINMTAFEKDNSSTKVKEEKIIELTKVVKEKKKEHQNLEEKADNLET